VAGFVSKPVKSAALFDLCVESLLGRKAADQPRCWRPTCWERAIRWPSWWRKIIR
jgi:hypothetical protein